MRDSAAFFKHLSDVGFIPRTIIDVGVANGTPDIYSAYPDAYYILIDAVAEYESGMREILKSLRGEYVITALSDRTGEAEMMVREPLYISSLQYGEDIRKEFLRTVPVDTLENILSERSVDGPIMLKTDCQGHDLQVIRGAGRALEDIEVIICELPMYGPWGGGPEFIDYVNGLDELGFRVYDIWGWLHRPGDQRLQHLDLVFVKTDGLLRQNKLFPQGESNLGYFRKHYKQET